MAKTSRDRVNRDVAHHQNKASKQQLKSDYRLFIAAAARCQDTVERERYCLLAEAVLKTLIDLKAKQNW